MGFDIKHKTSCYLFSGLDVECVLMIKLEAAEFVDAESLEGPEQEQVDVKRDKYRRGHR